MASDNNFDDYSNVGNSSLDSCDIETNNTSIMNSPNACKAPSSSKQVQVPDLPLRPYKEAEKRTQQVMRSKTIDLLADSAKKFVHFKGEDIPNFISDLVVSGKWKGTFGDVIQTESDTDDFFLRKLAADYRSCKDKAENKAIRLNCAKQKQRVLIGSSLKGSKISFSGVTSDIFKSRVEAAQDLGRIRSYPDEKRRLLSIVAMDFSYSTLQRYFHCSSKTITAARVHCILFGRGGVPSDNYKFTRQCVSAEVLEELTGFLYRDDVSRASSCRSVLVGGEETAVRYWQDTIKGLVDQYLLEFPNGVKRTYIYTHLPANFRMDTMLAGLCNLCDDFGHTNFDELCTFIEEVSSVCPGLNGSALIKDVRTYQKFLKTKFSKLAHKHSPCLELCMSYAFDSCTEDHKATGADFSPFYATHSSLLEEIESLPENATKAELKSRLAELYNTHCDYLSHLLRTKHQGEYYKFVLKSLKPGECVMIIDYKMKLELGKRTREIQRDWYGKRGISLHGCYVVAQVTENEKSSEVFDLWSEDTKQDAFFTQSALDVCFTWLERTFPGFAVYLFSGMNLYCICTKLCLSLFRLQIGRAHV